MILALDMDDTIMDTKNVSKGYKMGPPEVGAVTTINKLVEEGNQIVIFTARNVQDPRVKQAVIDWLKYFKIPFSDITNIKRPEFDVIIDNRCIEYRGSWSGILSKIKMFDVRQSRRNEASWNNDPIKEHALFTDITKPLDQQ